mmetsp:Transcript_18029/g.23734  ORF Transcript_18029/g.23734 Transcript_18029/m.23734 type:complete len:83 (-) Transcript_18029:1000-1248(-)
MSNTDDSNAVVFSAVILWMWICLRTLEAVTEGFAVSISGSALSVLTPEQKAEIDALVESVNFASRPVYFHGVLGFEEAGEDL